LALMGFGISSPVIPLFLEEDIGITDPKKLKVWVGLVNSCAAITMAIFAPIWGHLADTFSRRAMLLRALFGGAIIIAFMSFVNSPWQFLVLRSIQGCLTGTIAAATVLTACITPAAQLAFTLGMLQTGIAVGSSLGPLVGGVVSDFLGHRAAFFSTGLALALAGFIVLIWVKDDIRPSLGNKIKKFSLMPDFRPIASSPTLITMMLVTLGMQAANTVATPMLPLFLKEIAINVSGKSEYIGSSTGIVLGVGTAFTALAAVLVGKFSPRIGYWKTLFICFAAGAVMTIPQTFVTSMLQLLILRALSSFFIGGTMPLINAVIAVSSEKKHQGTIYGVNASVASTGAALGPMIGSMAAMLNYRAMFLTSAIMLALSALEIKRRAAKSGVDG